MYWLVEAITIRTLWYTLLFVAMLLIGGACYEQRFYAKKHDGKKMKTLELIGWCLIVLAVLGGMHGLLSVAHFILPL